MLHIAFIKKYLKTPDPSVQCIQMLGHIEKNLQKVLEIYKSSPQADSFQYLMMRRAVEYLNQNNSTKGLDTINLTALATILEFYNSGLLLAINIAKRGIDIDELPALAFSISSNVPTEFKNARNLDMNTLAKHPARMFSIQMEQLIIQN